jgi:hypothetical protein
LRLSEKKQNSAFQPMFTTKYKVHTAISYISAEVFLGLSDNSFSFSIAPISFAMVPVLDTIVFVPFTIVFEAPADSSYWIQLSLWQKRLKMPLQHWAMF